MTGAATTGVVMTGVVMTGAATTGAQTLVGEKEARETIVTGMEGLGKSEDTIKVGKEWTSGGVAGGLSLQMAESSETGHLGTVILGTAFLLKSSQCPITCHCTCSMMWTTQGMTNLEAQHLIEDPEMKVVANPIGETGIDSAMTGIGNEMTGIGK